MEVPVTTPTKQLLAIIAVAAVAGGCSAASPIASASPLLSAATPPAATSPAATSPRPHLGDGEAWIAYQNITSERSGAHAVHLVHPDGTGDFFALDMVPGGEQKHPDWSPDGRRLVLDVANSTHPLVIWMADLTDWSARKVIDCAAPCLWVQEPAWSRDGSKVAYQRHTTSAAGEVSTIEVLDLASGAASVVYETGTNKGVFAPRWSPGDTSLVFEQTAADGDTFLGVSLEVLDLATPDVTRTIVPVERMANNSDWSPDGSLIAFSAPVAGGEPGGPLSDIWVVNPDGTELRRITDVAASGGTAVQPTFTPDGARIMFKLTDERVGASDAIATIAVAGGDPQPATGSHYLYGWHARLRPGR